MNSARDAAYRALTDYERGPSRELKDHLDATLKRSNFANDDRRLAAELTYGVIRWRRPLDSIIKAFAKKGAKVRPDARRLLWLGVYQLLWMDRIPDHAAIHETVETAKRVHAPAGFVNALLRRVQREGDPLQYPDRAMHPADYLGERYSYPSWLTRRWIDARGVDEAEAICKAHNEPPPLTLRVNALRATCEAALKELRAAGAIARRGDYTENAVRAERLPPLADFAPFRDGLFTVQDESSQLVTELLDPRPGEVVLDLCAAPGGKATHIAERIGNRGAVVANDVSERGIARIRENVARVGTVCVETARHDARKPIPTYANRFDRVLADAPCSALGILRRRADARWNKSEEGIARCAADQRAILRVAANSVKPGGVLVYAVCTDTREETSEQTRAFLSERTDYSIEPTDFVKLSDDDGALVTKPHRHGIDGFYAIRFRRHA